MLAVAMKVNDGTITSSPGSSMQKNGRCSAAEPLAHVTACSAPTYSAYSASKAAHCSPWRSAPERSTPVAAAISYSVSSIFAIESSFLCVIEQVLS